MHTYWTIGMAGWDTFKGQLMQLLDVGALTSSYGWRGQFIDNIVMKTLDFNVMAGDRLSAIETGLAMGAALLATVDEGVGTALLTGQRARIGELLGMPETATVAPRSSCLATGRSAEAGGQRPRPDFEACTSRAAGQLNAARPARCRRAGRGRDDTAARAASTSPPGDPRHDGHVRPSRVADAARPHRPVGRRHRPVGRRRGPALHQVPAVIRGSVLDPAFSEKTTIARYSNSLGDLSNAERARRLQVVADFAAYVERDPAQMIAEVFDEQTGKYRNRGFYTDKANEFAASTDDSRNAALWRSNVIRAFIANGRRPLPEQADWMRTS
ncbi:MAG: hypothetical protein ACRDZO_18060 [Egibacteraceae bacterium]